MANGSSSYVLVSTSSLPIQVAEELVYQQTYGYGGLVNFDVTEHRIVPVLRNRHLGKVAWGTLRNTVWQTPCSQTGLSSGPFGFWMNLETRNGDQVWRPSGDDLGVRYTRNHWSKSIHDDKVRVVELP
jgi:hypothetical protein